MNTNEVAKVYNTILSISGMNETMKLNMQISRKNVLVFNRIIERGLTIKDNDKSAA